MRGGEGVTGRQFASVSRVLELKVCAAITAQLKASEDSGVSYVLSSYMGT